MLGGTSWKRGGEQLEHLSAGPALPLLITRQPDRPELPLGAKQALQETSVTLGWTFL